MLYYLFDWLDRAFDFPGAGVFQYISFRASMAAILSLLIMLFCGKPFIRFIRRKSIGETVRNLGLEGQKEKEGTPTMGGLIILSAIVIPTLLLAKLDNVYVITMLVTTLWLGLIGFIDDYIKVFKKDKAGMPGKFKVFGQVVLGLGVGGVCAGGYLRGHRRIQCGQPHRRYRRPGHEHGLHHRWCTGHPRMAVGQHHHGQLP